MRQNNMARDAEDQEIAEQKLWRAVIANTVREWIRGPLQRKRAAERISLSRQSELPDGVFLGGDRSGKPSRPAAKNSRTRGFRCACTSTSIKELILFPATFSARNRLPNQQF